MAEEDVVLEAFDKYLNNLADRIFELSQKNLVRDGKNDTGTLLKSGNVLRAPFEKTIVYTAPHAEPVEFGRLPGTKMYSGWLHKWVRRKLKITDEKEINRVAFAIAKAIEQRGFDPSPFLRPAAEQAVSEL